MLKATIMTYMLYFCYSMVYAQDSGAESIQSQISMEDVSRKVYENIAEYQSLEKERRGEDDFESSRESLTAPDAFIIEGLEPGFSYDTITTTERLDTEYDQQGQTTEYQQEVPSVDIPVLDEGEHEENFKSFFSKIKEKWRKLQR
ncbi:MAG: hypothetical protein JSW40_00315 [Candidatus Omnitrophota bacterium]|nr:MAG: hypothetical protein JSW40_00315 [Candidatus Omnitrophota bacterium]